MYMRKPPLAGLNVVVQFDLDMNYDNVDQCCTISTQLQLSINKAQVEVLILGTLSTTVPYLTHTSYPMTYMDYPLCYEHNNVKTTITLLGHDCLFIRSYNNVIILCGVPSKVVIFGYYSYIQTDTWNVGWSYILGSIHMMHVHLVTIH